jgi:ferredoxin
LRQASHLRCFSEAAVFREPNGTNAIRTSQTESWPDTHAYYASVYSINEFHSTAISPEDTPNERKVMANRNDRLRENAPGAFYVDSSCIDCDLCRGDAPQFFRRDDESGYSIVHKQPVTPEEVREAQDALEGCPTESIGNDGIPASASPLLGQ